MKRRSRAIEIRRLVRELGSTDRSKVDAARARLAIIGEPAIPRLLEALEGNDARLRARVMPLLAMIRDPRGREPLMAELLEQDVRLRLIAIRCLARFPDEDVVAVLNRLVVRERDTTLRVAALRSLIEQVAAGNERAIRVVLDRLLDEDECPSVRLEAMALIRSLGPNQRGVVLTRLQRDGDDAIRDAAASIGAEPCETERFTPPRIAGWIEELKAPDYAVWDGALARLAGGGERVVRPLVRAMEARSHDAEFCTRAGMALKALGPQRARAIGQALDEVAEPLPLRVLVDVIGSLGEKSMIYRLTDLIHRVAHLARETPQPRRKWLERVRAKAHLELSRIGSRVAIADLREALGEADGPLEPELVAAVARIGKREEIPLLLAAWEAEEPGSRRRIGDAVREIARRERIGGGDRLWSGLEEDQRAALGALLGGNRRGSRPRRRPPETST